MDDLRGKGFLWGVLLAWSTLPPVVYGCANTFRGLSQEKATGLGALVGGMAAGLVPYGLVLTVLVQFAAILMLIRGFSKERTGRSVVSAISICWSVLTLFLLATVVFLYLKMPR